MGINPNIFRIVSTFKRSRKMKGCSMKATSKIALLSVFTVFCTFTQLSRADMTSGDSTILGQEIKNGPVKIYRGLQSSRDGGNFAVLTVDYDGPLLQGLEKDSNDLELFIEIPYQNGARQMSLKMKILNGGRFASAKITGGCLEAAGSGCKEKGTEEMRALLAWAQRADGTLNLLNVRVAVYNNKTGEWDNNGRAFGSYDFQFPQIDHKAQAGFPTRQGLECRGALMF